MSERNAVSMTVLRRLVAEGRSSRDTRDFFGDDSLVIAAFDRRTWKEAIALVDAPDGEAAAPPAHEHYWTDAPNDEQAWYCAECGLTEYPGESASPSAAAPQPLDVERLIRDSLNEPPFGHHIKGHPREGEGYCTCGYGTEDDHFDSMEEHIARTVLARLSRKEPSE